MLLDARSAPRGPEVHDGHLALGEIAGRKAFDRRRAVRQALDRRKRESRRRLSEKRRRQLGRIAARKREREQNGERCEEDERHGKAPSQ